VFGGGGQGTGREFLKKKKCCKKKLREYIILKMIRHVQGQENLDQSARNSSSFL
jgi:predicted molibdopterin-dependent oxidoreductase YjgC